jgi:hypothetical protein
MPYETDERLKGFLDTNQLLREQLCAALLSVDPRFSNVRAQHPRGGPDGGADITATYKLTLDAIAAVGFVNQATDSPTHRRSASRKFASDLERSLSRSRVPDAFVFFTNVSLTNTQKVKLTDMGYSAGLSHCDIIDREQMRLRLDSSEGLAIRYQYLRIPMSEAEQALFFSKWGEKINQSISEGFSETTKLLNRVQFFHEATYGLRELSVLMELDREYPEEELGAVSAHARVLFPRPMGTLLGIQFSSVKHKQSVKKRKGLSLRTSISELHFNSEETRSYSLDPADYNRYKFKRRQCGEGSFLCSPGPVGSLRISAVFGYAPSALLLRDLDRASCFVYANDRLAQKITGLFIYTDRYQLAVHQRQEWDVEEFLGGFETEEGQEVSPQDPLRRLYLRFYPFYFDFSQSTPVRRGSPLEVGSLAER